MSITRTLKPIAIAVGFATAGLTLPNVASADFSATFAVSNFYLFRGENLSGGTPAVSGSIDYAHSSGMYAGVWASSTGRPTLVAATDSDYDYGQETDYYIGYANSVGELSYDIMLIAYQYPEAPSGTGTAASDHYGDESELSLSFEYGGFNFQIVDALHSQNAGGDYVYYNFGYAWETVGINYGSISYGADGATEPAHFDVTYSPLDDLTFIASFIIDDDDDDSVDTDPLYNVTWSKTFDL